MKFIKENFDKSVERERKIARFLESKENERKLSFGKKDSVRKWYEHDFADDAISVEDMDPSITFEVAASYVVPDANGKDRFYNKMGSVDSFVRENIFTKIAEIYGVSYDDVYETWMGTPDTKLLDALKADGVVECLTEEKEDGEENVYRVTYKASDKIFSSFMIKAKDKDDAIDKAMAYRKKKYDKDTDIVGAEKMSASEVDDYKRRGMSLVESLDPDKEYKGRMMIINYKKGNSSLEKLHKDLVDLFDGDIKTAFNFLVDNENVKIKESKSKKLKEDKDSDKEAVRSDIEALSDGMEETEEIPASPETMDAMSVANTLNALIQDEWQAIDGYNGTISTYRAMAQDDYPEKDKSIDYDAIIKILEDIAQEEMNHVGMLQKAMGTISPNVSEIKGGEEEAEETLENPEAVEVVGEEDAE